MQKASVLILALWALLFLSILAILSGSMARQEILVVKKIELRNNLYDLASSGIMVAVDCNASNKGNSSSDNVYALNESAADRENFFKDVKLGGGYFSLEYEYVNNITGLKEKRYGVIDEERKININYASEDVLERLFASLCRAEGQDAKLFARAVIDWRDEDDNLNNDVKHLSERLDYSSKGYGYAPKNSNFKILEELLLVKGVSIKEFLKMKGYITVFGSGKVNINTASRQALKALGMGEELADKIVYFRCGPDMIEGTWDDNVFLSLQTAVKDLSAYYDLTEEEKAVMEGFVSGNLVGIDSRTFLALCTSRLGDDGARARVSCVFDKSGRIHYWGYQ